MKHCWIRWFRAVFLLILCSWFLSSQRLPQGLAQEASAFDLPVTVLPESQDFATVAYGDAWDMEQYTDISVFMNGGGRNPSFTNVQLQNGVFSANTMWGIGVGELSVHWMTYPYFVSDLHPYLPDIMNDPRFGIRHPIQPDVYNCLYVAMEVNSPTWMPSSPYPADGFMLLWYANGETVSTPAKSPNGGAAQIWLYPEDFNLYDQSNPLPHTWKLYRVRMAAPVNGLLGGAASWNSWSQGWQGFQIAPTTFAHTDFAIDWIRFTNCQDPTNKYKITFTFTPNANLHAVWVNPIGTDRNIQVDTDLPFSDWGGFNGSSGSYTLDTKGLMPGRYRVGLGTYSACCSVWSNNELTINQAAIPTFDRPSPYSGEDYATAGGNPWDMEPSDVWQTECFKSYGYTDNAAAMTTSYPQALPDSCTGPQLHEADPKMYLNMPAPIASGKDYRYLSFKISTVTVGLPGEGWRLPADGYLVRLIWRNQYNCDLVSNDIPLDVGWQIVTVDLYDPLNGAPILTAPTSGCAYLPWWEATEIRQLRIDPNENYTGRYAVIPAMDFYQELDWIRLTKVDGVQAGNIFPIEITLNKSPQSLQSIDFYYTDNLSTPLQNYIGSYAPALGQQVGFPLANGFSLFLPAIFKNYVSYPPLGPNQVRYVWDTQGMPVGEYYICAQSNDGLNTSVYCSNALMKISP